MRRIAFIFGTRPEAIKCAPVINRLKSDGRFQPIVVSTGQHREMLDTTLDEFGITPDIDLNVMQPRQTLSQVTHRIIEALSARIDDLSADAVVVHGDTASTLAGALAAFQHGIPVIHLEAGLRSGNIRSPFPEEANRRLVAQITDLHLAPTIRSSANLIREGACECRVKITGNTVVDALHWAAANAPVFEDPALADLMTDQRRVVVASAHRRETWGTPMRAIAAALVEIAANDRVRIVVPLHKNLAVRDVMVPALTGIPNITLVDPLPYRSFCRLMLRADIIISDSSGAEEEGPSLGKPTLVLRDVTERPEAVEAGTAKLVGRDTARIVGEVTNLLENPEEYERMAQRVSAYGDGNATGRVVEAISEFLNIKERENTRVRLAS
ncbi:UDP-N-acetylglucosamine 2-epimerase [Roseomonas sp. TAS13]|nr:UDP-N-acetylglucosamine 2-epimerase (non-hydrolyzing) [Roseomonas sp. TAS13]EKV6967485.1 UDP-N-acetylglucosamine 2-epimerase (non-hydrolyzing) [Pseudomonas aeruginosa]USQ70292.1 UDP-N-acetylglucosamine 2-epimerase (non-hydrolyzing) [Roseomonas mucosa]EKW2845511.1 UDP-N-acetylglucosamine 2-epimerase (non-hydrolyzing) [Pseudomonas aeruginosa]GAV32407.1 UDP-N-acetylglucosamine 2-epimerase [Roseomonas sp. TAS13]HBO1272384.1 UDP-N-acetylglucosamine 2-epimerase (non-hydrolyzing) [Pseudomonas aeru